MSSWEAQLIIYGLCWLFDWLKCTMILFIEMYNDLTLYTEYDLSWSYLSNAALVTKNPLYDHNIEMYVNICVWIELNW